jgi:hypothetical protein
VPPELVLEQRREARRPAAQRDHVLGKAAGLDSHRDGRRIGGFRDEQQRVTAGLTADGTELVAGDQNLMCRDAVASQPLEDPARRVGLVGEADLDVLRLARHPRVGEARVARRRLRQLDDLAQAPEAGAHNPCFDGGEQLGVPGLRRVGPLPLGDQVDPPAIEPLRDDLGAEAALEEALDRERRGDRQHDILLGRGEAALEEVDAVLVHQERLRPVVETEVEMAGARRPRMQLSVDVVDVRAADHCDVDPERACALDRRPERAHLGSLVGHGRSVPVEDQRLEPPVDA